MIDIRNARADDRAEILNVAEASGLFSAEEMPYVADSFDSWSPDDPHEGTLWLSVEGGGGAAMVAPEAMSDNVWNMLFIAVSRNRQRAGRGNALLTEVEARILARGARMMLIDTASGEDQTAARSFYVAAWYAQVAVIPGYYGEGIDRITFARTF